MRVVTREHRYTAVRGVGCTKPRNTCSVTVGDIARKLQTEGIGISRLSRFGLLRLRRVGPECGRGHDVILNQRDSACVPVNRVVAAAERIPAPD
jgi:hypothetical protein